MNLVMIGRFKEATDAAAAKRVIEQLTEQVEADVAADLVTVGNPSDRYSDEMLDLLRQVRVHTVGPAELEQFAYDVTVKLNGNQVVVKTDEVDVSAFLKVLLEKGARLEVYSAHDYPEAEHGRGASAES